MQPVEVHRRIQVGDLKSLCRTSPLAATVHACKDPCYRKAAGRWPKSDPEFLAFEKEDEQGPHLYLNMIDPPQPLFKVEMLEAFLRFALEHYTVGTSLHIHCCQGKSRAPSLALLFLAKGLGVLPDSSYAEARAAFQPLYPAYAPGRGIEKFLTDNWGAL